MHELHPAEYELLVAQARAEHEAQTGDDDGGGTGSVSPPCPAHDPEEGSVMPKVPARLRGTT